MIEYTSCFSISLTNIFVIMYIFLSADSKIAYLYDFYLLIDYF